MTTQQFSLDEEQIAFRDVVRKFAEEKIAPLAAEADRTQQYSWEAFKALQSMELTALSYPVEYGGSGASLVTQAVVAEELSRVCASTGLIFLISKLGMLPVINFGSEELKNKYLPGISTGESQASYGLSEADAGSDVASMTTRAVRDGDDWVINGSKIWITNAGISNLYTIFIPSFQMIGLFTHLRKKWKDNLNVSRCTAQLCCTKLYGDTKKATSFLLNIT